MFGNLQLVVLSPSSLISENPWVENQDFPPLEGMFFVFIGIIFNMLMPVFFFIDKKKIRLKGRKFIGSNLST